MTDMQKNMAGYLIIEDSMAPNLTLTSDMQTNDVVCKHIWRVT